MKRLRLSRSARGQSVVEFAIVLPVILFLVLGMVEIGFAIDHG
jgi:Flp pilus assembly protein TadG